MYSVFNGLSHSTLPTIMQFQAAVHIKTHVKSAIHYNYCSYQCWDRLLLKSNSLHITLYFEETLCVTVTYYLEIKVTT